MNSVFDSSMVPMDNEIYELRERVVSLETRAAFQEKTIDDLSAVIAEQHAKIDALREKISLLQDQLGAGMVEKGRDELPPHY
jgi:uncharacterized coiled-coil protein SlyX